MNISSFLSVFVNDLSHSYEVLKKSHALRITWF
jgi:hypothetical protein